ncbi:hypothetical protein JCM10020v2_007653 [Rhodotorula toruloides]
MTGLSACCSSGYVHEGTPVGTFEDVNDVSRPQGDYDKTKAFLILTDIFGVELPNGQLIADAFASKVPVAVYMPDYLFDDPVPRTNLTLPAEEKKKRLGEWLSRHGQDVTAPAVDEVIKGLRGEGRARCVVDLCISSPPVLSAGAVAHPSLLDVPDDLHALDASTVEFLWLHMLQDFVFTRDKQELAKEITKNNPKHVHADFDGGHGSANRCDPNNPQERKAADDAFDKTVAWLKERFMHE